MTIDHQSLGTQGLAIQIAANIREAIVAGRLTVDERLPTEEELASRWGVSRPTIREALKRLAAQNLIRSRRGPTGGTFVSLPSHAEARHSVANVATLLVSLGELGLHDIAEARLELELVCCRLAATRRTTAQLASLAAEIDVQRCPKLSDEEFCASDVRFHRTLVEAAGNPALDLVGAGIIAALQPAVNMVVFRFRDRNTVATQHERVYRALTASDAEAACAALGDYMRDLRKQYAQAQKARTGAASRVRRLRRA